MGITKQKVLDILHCYGTHDNRTGQRTIPFESLEDVAESITEEANNE